MCSSRAFARRPATLAPADMGRAVFRWMISRYSLRVTPVSWAWRFWRISPSARAAQTFAVISTMSSSNRPPIPNALTKRKSPVTSAFWRPNFLYAARRPRRMSPPSLMSSWISVAEWISSNAAARSTACRTSVPPRARKASNVTMGRIRLPPDSITYRAISWRRGSSVRMLSRIRASTKASSLVTPKSSEPMIGAVPSRAIAWPYITISSAHDPCQEGMCPEGETASESGLCVSGAAGDFVDRLGDALRGHGSVPRDPTDGRRDRFEERVDHVVAVADPIRHHHHGHHDRHERVHEGLVVHVRGGEANRLRREVRDPSEMAVVVVDRQVRVVVLQRREVAELLLAHRNQGQVRDPVPKVLMDAHDVVHQDHRGVVVIPAREETLHVFDVVRLVGKGHVDQVVSARGADMPSELLPPVHRVVGGVEVLHDFLHLGDREVRFLLEHGERLAERDPFVHHFHLVEVLVSVGRAVPQDVEAADDVVDQVEQRDLLLTQHGHEPLHERRRIEVRVQHRAEDHVVEVLRLQIGVVALVDEVVQDADHAFSEDLRGHRTMQILRRHVRAVLLRHHRRPSRETQRLQVVPHLALVFPESAGGDVRRPQRYTVRGREVPESLQARVDVRDMVPQSGLIEPEIVEVEEALRIPAEAEHGPRQEIEVFPIDA